MAKNKKYITVEVPIDEYGLTLRDLFLESLKECMAEENSDTLSIKTVDASNREGNALKIQGEVEQVNRYLNNITLFGEKITELGENLKEKMDPENIMPVGDGC